MPAIMIASTSALRLGRHQIRYSSTETTLSIGRVPRRATPNRSLQSIPSHLRPLSNTSHLKKNMSTPTAPLCTLASLDHLVLTVSSLPATVKFYTEILGMAHQSFTSPTDPSTVRHALLFGQQKINLHQAGKEFEPKAKTALPGTADLCFLTEADVGAVLEGFKEKGIEVLEGAQVVRRTGARSPLRSVYVRDPDGNLIEISNPTV